MLRSVVEEVRKENESLHEKIAEGRDDAAKDDGLAHQFSVKGIGLPWQTSDRVPLREVVAHDDAAVLGVAKLSYDALEDAVLQVLGFDLAIGKPKEVDESSSESIISVRATSD